MKRRNSLYCFAAVTLLLTAGVARAQCGAVVRTVSQANIFPNLMAGPVATTGSVVALAKSDATTGAPAIFFATYDLNLNQLSLDRQVVSSSLSASALFWTGTEFDLFYLRTDYSFVMQRISASGDPIGSPIVMPHLWAANDELDVTWSPSLNAYGVAHFVTSGPDLGLWLSVVSPTGNVLSDLNISVFGGSPQLPRVVALPAGKFGIMWSRQISPPITLLAIVNPADAGSFRAVTISDRVIFASRLATNGDTILATYATPLTGGGTELRYALVNINSVTLTGEASLTRGSGPDVAPQSLIWNPALSEWALVYLDMVANTFADSRLRRFKSPSSLASDTLLSPDPTHSRLSAPYPMVFTNGAYYASIQRPLSRVEGSDSYLLKVCPFFATPTSDSSFAFPFAPVTFTANASGGAKPYRFEWNFGDNGIATGAIVQHLYSASGTYTVTLSGTDTAGAISISTTTVVISAGGRRHAVRH